MGSSKAMLLNGGRYLLESCVVEGSTKRCFRCMEVGHFKANCPKSEGTSKMRCFKCNSEDTCEGPMSSSEDICEQGQGQEANNEV